MNVSVTKVDSSTNVNLTKGISQQVLNQYVSDIISYKNTSKGYAEASEASATSASESAASALNSKISASASATR